MKTAQKPLAETTRRAITILTKELGIVETIRFLNQFSPGYGDYTHERDAIFQGATIDDILSEIHHVQKSRMNKQSRQRAKTNLDQPL